MSGIKMSIEGIPALEKELRRLNSVRFGAVGKKQLAQMLNRARQPGGTPVYTEKTRPGGPHGELRLSSSVNEDEMGYIYPIIDQKKCINCGMCKNVCPNINMIKLHESKKAYAMWNNNKNIRNKSTSGGIATTLCEYIIENNGVAYGCNNKINDNIKFIRLAVKF